MLYWNHTFAYFVRSLSKMLFEMILYKYGIMAMRHIHGRFSGISSSYRCISTSLFFFLFISLINFQFCNRSFLLARSILPFTLGNISCAFTCINVLVCMREAEFNAFWKLLSNEEFRYTRDIFLLDLELGHCWASAWTGCYVIRCRWWCTALCDEILYFYIKLIKEHKNNFHCLLGMICLYYLSR